MFYEVKVSIAGNTLVVTGHTGESEVYDTEQ